MHFYKSPFHENLLEIESKLHLNIYKICNIHSPLFLNYFFFYPNAFYYFIYVILCNFIYVMSSFFLLQKYFFIFEKFIIIIFL